MNGLVEQETQSKSERNRIIRMQKFSPDRMIGQILKLWIKIGGFAHRKFSASNKIRFLFVVTCEFRSGFGQWMCELQRDLLTH